MGEEEKKHALVRTREMVMNGSKTNRKTKREERNKKQKERKGVD